MKIICVSYRSWALNIYEKLQEQTKHHLLIINSKDDYDENVIYDFKPDLILYYGWSWLVSDKIINNYKCVMLHPAPLPRYRGGSPLQNQIISGEKKSAVTLFIMTEKLDDGNIIGQAPLSLSGYIPDIFKRIEKIGLKLTLNYLKGDYKELKQESSNATIFKRRKSSASEILLDEIMNKDGEYLYNKIRMLTGPYPNAFIRTKDNKRLIIKLVELVD